MRKTKISFLKFYGGMLKNVEDGKIDFSEMSAKVSPEESLPVVRVASPFAQKLGWEFVKAASRLFFIPIGIAVLFFYISLSLLVFSDKSVFWKAIAILPLLSAFFYAGYSLRSMSNRARPDETYMKYSFLGVYGSVGIAIVTLQPGFYLSVLFFLGVGLFVYEEFFRKEAHWMLKKGVEFWRIDDDRFREFLIVSELQEEEKK